MTVDDRPDPMALAAAAARAGSESPFLRGLLRRRPEIAGQLGREGLAATLRAAREEDGPLAVRLRRERQAVALATALADLAGAPLETVTRALSDFADQALDRAIAEAVAERVPGADPAGFVALALGKQGSRELNYSSDIDPILLFDPATLPRRMRDDPAEAADRYARRIVSLLQERTADGHVLRVDLRLRPAAEASALAVAVAVAIQHYESSALPWERAAFIRARAAGGDVAFGRGFLAEIRPFVWRRSLDFGAIREVRALTRRIRDHHGAVAAPGPGYDLKRGRGGIREIEFFAQIHQLIHGGREPALRAPATLDALAALAAAGRIDAKAGAVLADSYRLLRTIEHRLQMIDDRQTHRLPDDPAALDAVARLAGYEAGGALVAALTPVTDAVGRLYDALDGESGAPTRPIASTIATAGFADPARAAAMVERWASGKARTTRSPIAREALIALLPDLLAGIGASPAPDMALARFDALVDALPSALNLFRLLEARPSLLGLLARILALAPPLAADLGRRAELLDGLIDASALDATPAVPTLVLEFRRGEAGEDHQARIDRVIRTVGERRFACGAQLVAGSVDPIEIGRGYGRIADAAIETLAAATVAEFEGAHGRVPGSELVLLALGRLGGGILTHASDLDLVLLFTGDFLATSDGPRPLGATAYYNRLAQRVIGALSLPTATGPLYAVDTRLRPSGAQGLIAVSLDSFARYEAEAAWTWEHMALTRARPVFGSAEARAALDAIVAATLRRPREPARVVAEVAAMRSRIAEHKRPAGPFDVKLMPGGLVDAEFTVQLVQLRDRVGLTPDMLAAAAAIEQASHVASGFAAAVALMTRMLIALRLVAPDGSEPHPATRALLAEASGTAGWEALVTGYAEARALVAAEWARVSRPS